MRSVFSLVLALLQVTLVGLFSTGCVYKPSQKQTQVDTVSTNENIFENASHEEIVECIEKENELASFENDKKEFNYEIEFKTIVYDKTTNQDYSYLDFVGNNGYIVVADNCISPLYEMTGDIPIIRNFDDKIFFDDDLGLCYFDGVSCQYISFVQEKNESDTASTPFVSTSTDSNGRIKDADLYMSQRYSHLNYSFKSYHSMSSYFPITHQEKTSVYYEYCQDYNFEARLGTTRTEKNCTLNTNYMILSFWRDIKGKQAIHDGVTPIYPNIDESVYKCQVVNNSDYRVKGVSGMLYSLCEVVLVPNPYYRIREYAKEEGYLPYNDFSFYKANLCTYKTIRGYGYNVDWQDSIKIKNDTIKNELDNDRPIMLCVNNCAVYGNHAMAMIGYKAYSVKIRINRFITIILGEKLMVEVADGWDSRFSYWYDAPTNFSVNNASACITTYNIY